MPILKHKKHLYPKNWKEISAQVRIKAGNKCELCDRKNGEYYLKNTCIQEPKHFCWDEMIFPKDAVKIVLTVHHLDFNPQNNEEYNLMALCQRCHNRLDIKKRIYDRKQRRT